jgi:hypothetical protein
LEGETDVSLSEDMAKYCLEASAKQQTIDAEFETSATKLRDAYVVQLKKEAAKATGAGQAGIAKGIEAKADAAGMLAAWLEEMGLSLPAASGGGATGSFSSDKSGFVGKWKLGEKGRITWNALADGSVVASAGRDKQGTWKDAAGGVEVTWPDGRSMKFRKRGKTYEGEDQRGREIVLSRAD